MVRIGDSTSSREAGRLVTGTGGFADDARPERLAHAVFARSPHSHARIASIDVQAARTAPGVIDVLTGADVLEVGLRPIPHPLGSSTTGSDIGLANRDGSERASTPHMVLPTDRVRYVGEAYAAVVAETAELARDAVELIEVDWEELPAATLALDALSADAPLLWDHIPGNLALEADIGDHAAADKAFSQAAHVVRLESQVQRVTGMHMEPRAVTVEYDPANDHITLHASGGNGVVVMRDQLAAVLGVPPEQVRVVAPRDVGGNFGTRNAFYPEFAVVALASRRTGRPVRHVADRSEAFLSDYQGRDLHIDAELALDAEGRFLAIRSVNTANLGAHIVSYVPLNKGAQLMTGVYRVGAACVTARAALSNTPSTIPYRSAGRPEAMYAVERLIDLAARETGIDPIELRRRNIIGAADQPFRNPLGVTFDSGDYEAVMDRALELIDREGFAARRAEALSRGRFRGLGFANYIEGTGGIPRERAEISVDASRGLVDVVIGTQASGQSHETAFSQLVAALLGVSQDQVQIRSGDTAFVAAGGGTHSGRSLRFASIVFGDAADQIISRSRELLASRWGCTAGEIEFEEGRFRSAASNEVLDLFEVARLAAPEGILSAIADITTPGLAFPYGAAACEVEIDPETGAWEIVRYVSVDDVGRVLNPTIVHGQTHGGIVQGAGQALMEWSRFDRESGQALSASLMDYAVARAADFPSFVTDISEVPSPRHPMGFRPGGEGGTTPALGLVVNAVVDALAHLGVRHVEMPATPLQIWQAIRAAQQGRI